MANVLSALLFLAGLLAAFIGVAVFKKTGDMSAIHEIEGLICFLIAACGIGFAAVVSAINARTQLLETELRAIHKLSAEAGQRDVQRVMASQRREA